MNKKDNDIKKIFDIYLDKDSNLNRIEKRINKRKVNLIKYLFPVTLCLITGIMLFASFYKENNSNRVYNGNVNYNVKNESSNEISISSELKDILYDITDPKVLYKISTHVAIVKVTSIDGVTRIDPNTNKGVIDPFTYGNAEVIREIKGEFKSKSIKYRRHGGKMPYLKWLEGDVDPDKLLSIAKENGVTDEELEKRIVNCKYPGDIEIKEGKIYLAYIYHNPKVHKEDEYSFQGYQYGLKEIPFYSEIIDTKELRVLDNETKELIAIKDLIEF